eukprot:1266485-Amphidinium_carterae.1
MKHLLAGGMRKTPIGTELAFTWSKITRTSHRDRAGLTILLLSSFWDKFGSLDQGHDVVNPEDEIIMRCTRSGSSTITTAPS